ncbi:hypothetical protein D3C85_730270 [compost metagenome]
MAPGVVQTMAALRAAMRCSIHACMRCRRGSGGYGASGSLSSSMGSRWSAIHGRPLSFCKVIAIRCAVAIGYVDQMASGRYSRIMRRPAGTALSHQELQRSGSARQRG